jgi:putative salt-induced outer membrane protein YdiY
MKSSQLHFLALAAYSVLSLSGPAHAQTKKPDGLWHGNVTGGLSLASGNTRSTSLSLVADTAKETEQDKTTFYGLVLRADNKANNVSTKTADLLRVGGRYDRVISDRLFGYAGLEFEKDDLQNLRLRALGSLGLGYKVTRTESTSFDVFGGVGYVRNDFKDIRLLGRILGDVIREQEGKDAFELIERVRQLSVAYRLKADASAGRVLDRLLKNLSADQTVT